MANDFTGLLKKLKTDKTVVQVALAPLGIVPATVRNVAADYVKLEIKVVQSNGAVGKRIINAHYTSVVIVT